MTQETPKDNQQQQQPLAAAVTGLYIAAAGFAGGMATMHLLLSDHEEGSVANGWGSARANAEKELQKRWHHTLLQMQAKSTPEGHTDDDDKEGEDSQASIDYITMLNDCIVELEIANKYQAYDTRRFSTHFCKHGFARLKKAYDFYANHEGELGEFTKQLRQRHEASPNEESKRWIRCFDATLAYLHVLENKYEFFTKNIPEDSRLKGLEGHFLQASR